MRLVPEICRKPRAIGIHPGLLGVTCKYCLLVPRPAGTPLQFIGGQPFRLQRLTLRDRSRHQQGESGGASNSTNKGIHRLLLITLRSNEAVEKVSTTKQNGQLGVPKWSPDL